MDSKQLFRLGFMQSIRYILIPFIFGLLFLNCNKKNQSPDKIISNIATIDSNFKTTNLTPILEYIEDKEGNLSFEEIQKREKDWLKLKNDEFTNFGFNPSFFWIRFTVENITKDKQRPIFEISFPRQDYIEFYSETSGRYETEITGDIFPFHSRKINHLGFAFELEIEANTKKTYFLRTRSIYNRSILNPHLHTQIEFHQRASERNLVNGILYGLMGIMLFYNFFLYLTIREKVHLYSSVSIVFYLLITLGIHGTSYQYLYPDFPWIQNRDYTIFTPLVTLFIVLYTNEYLDLKVTLPKVYKILKLFNAFTLGMAFTFPFLVEQFSKLIFQFILNFCFFFVVFAFLLGAYLSVKRYRPAYFFMSSFSVFFVSIVIAFLTVNTFLPASFLGYWSFQIGFSSMLILLALGTADKINYLKNNLKEANEFLEYKVDKRTQELKEAIAKIKIDLKTASKIQKNILPKNKTSIQKLKISTEYLPLEEVGGDFYDITELQNGVIRIFLADATGHGIQAALMTMSIYSEYQNIKEYQLDAGEILNILNKQYYYRYYYLNAYFTCILVDIDLEKKKIYYSSAGHPDQILFLENKTTLLKSSGKLMGVLKDVLYKTCEEDFREGSRLLLFTDGIFEELNKEGEEFGEERFLEGATANRYLPNEEFPQKTIQSVFQFMNGSSLQDDITLLTIDY
ncbi:MAG TPA: SpoIIE family protein phosphatase [Leptospiraceae bacterium]|nr:SpoIIE family protein phosphatase [Leptospiraceae bacterium]HMX33305.1 SpoIIE family protein phosphatase [Leptospiraceae bacterium]HMZ63983.1 SpoIIE family protein phosphatase [Leptospiraceae bacterium]HNA07377.1 SpoIIE family protein phosphatase [Leptospiraceae bacterium]HNC56484.1 SpoIIE family protein phosphatase [Leptospiraceae bacterium]